MWVRKGEREGKNLGKGVERAPCLAYTLPIPLWFSPRIVMRRRNNFCFISFFTLYGVPEWNAEKELIFSQRGGSLLQSLPSTKTVHRTVLVFTPYRAPTVWGFRPLRRATMGFRPLTLMTLLKKGQSKTFSFLTVTKTFAYCVTVNSSAGCAQAQIKTFAKNKRRKITSAVVFSR